MKSQDWRGSKRCRAVAEEDGMVTLNGTVPAHVPASLVYDYDRFRTPAKYESPQFAVGKALAEEAPPIFWTPRYGGHWVVAKASAAAELLARPDLFSSEPQFQPWKDDLPTRGLPISYDPPEHAEARQIITPLFTPRAVAAMEAELRGLCNEILDDVLPAGQCEFVRDVAKRFPITVFLRLVGAPIGDAPMLLDMVERYLRNPDRDITIAAANELASYIAALIEQRVRERDGGTAGSDLISQIVSGQMLGRPLTIPEMNGAAFLLFLAGLDSVAAVMTFTIKFLAQNPNLYEQLVDEPARIRQALEELLRVSGVSTPERGARADCEFMGVTFKKNDPIFVLLPISGFDPDLVEDPQKVVLDRELSRHYIFGAGPHRCIGSHLARLEIRAFLEEWVKRVPRFQIAEAPIAVSGGVVWLPDSLPLSWGVRDHAENEECLAGQAH